MKKIICLLLFIVVYNLFADTELNYGKEQIEQALITQINLLNPNELKLLDITKIIVGNPKSAYIKTIDIEGIIVSDVIISKTLVLNSKDRYYISHYIRNTLLNGITEYDIKTKQYIPVATQYQWDGYDEYIQNNAEQICEVIYYFYHKNYYGAYKIYPSEIHLLFNDARLGNSGKKILQRIKDEESYFPYNIEYGY